MNDNKHDDLRELARQYDMEAVSVNAYRITSRLIELIAKPSVRQFRCVPIELIGDRLTVAIGNPQDLQTMDTVQRTLRGYDVSFVLADPGEIDQLIERHW